MTLKTPFEKEVCGRCGGSGRYSYNQMDGDRCFGCAGNGERLTKRGFVAHEHFAQSLMVPLGSLKVGDQMRVEMFSPGMMVRYFAPITSISEPHTIGWTCDPKTGEKVKEHIGITVETTSRRHGLSGLTGTVDTMVRKAWPDDFKAAKLAEALAFQATLNKKGQPMAQKAVA